MLSAVITLFETFKTIGYYSIFLSYTTGKIIVNGLLSCFEILHKLFYTLWTVLVILQEDLLVFLSDVWNRIVIIIYEINNFTEYLSESIVSVFTGIKYVVTGTSTAIITFFQTIITIITKVFSSFGTLIASIKHLIVLFGSGVWFAITIIPVFIVYVCMMATYYIGRSFEELKTFTCALASQIITGIKDVFTFVTDVPLEALAGLIIIACLIYAVAVFHIVVYSTLSKFARFILTTMNRNVVRLKTALFRRRNNRAARTDTETSSSSSGSEFSEEELDSEPQTSNNPGWKTKRQLNRELLELGDRLCVICLERNKCMLSLPCRHLCMCKECSEILRNYQRNCPICRRFVAQTIHVF